MINDKLYFFKDMIPKRFFLADYRYSISAGDARWNQWRAVLGLDIGTGGRSSSNDKTIIFNTNCTTNQHSLNT